MKALIVSSLVVLGLARPASPQATTFDIATFTPPAGWQRIDQNGIVQLLSMHTARGKTTYCQIFLFPSHPGSTDAMANFSTEWTRLVAQPFATATLPRPESKTTADGWTGVTGSVNVVQRGIPVTAILFTVTGHDRVMSIAINDAGPEYASEVRQFFSSLTFRANDQAQTGPVAGAPATPPAPTPQAPPAPQSAGGPASLDSYIYSIHQGWTRANYPDGIVYGSSLFNNGERCQISIFQMRQASGDLVADARRAYGDIFQTDPFQNNDYPYPAATFTRGTSADGWNYFIIQKSIHGRFGDYGTLLGTRLMAVQLGSQVAIITGTGKDPQVSMCFGELVHDEWPQFFYSIRFKNWTPVPPDPPMPRRIAGIWTTATASVADRYSFAPNGRFASAAAAMTSTRLSQTEILQTTNAYFGDGAYAIKGNTITLTSDNNSGNPKQGWFRLEQDSKDGGATWTDRLCLLFLENGGDVCYSRDQGP